MEKRYKEIDGVRYQVIQNTILGSNVVPVGESLPEVTSSDSGKVLGVNSSGEWVPVDAPSDLPEVTSADAGDVLTVNASGEWEAAAPGGGGGSLTLYGPFVFYVDELNPVSVLAGGTETVPLPSIKDYDGHTFTLSGLSSDAVFVLQSFGTAGNGLLCAKIVEPYYFNASWSAPSGYVTNVSDVQQSIQSDSDFFVQFMCTEQLSEAT